MDDDRHFGYIKKKIHQHKKKELAQPKTHHYIWMIEFA
jgi:hypothetical protein